jgi:outer membrane protein insertion porin family
VEFSSEARVAAFGKVGLVAFVDAGNVWADSWDFDLGDLRVAAGPGLRYDTPIGPVRFDVGVQLTPIDNLLVDGKPERRRWRMHFSIGHAF